MQIDKETTASGDVHHGQTDVGMSPVQLTNSKRCEKGVLVLSLPTNTATVYVGIGNRVRTSNGFPLKPGGHISMPIDDPGQVYCIADDIDQKIAWMVG